MIQIPKSEKKRIKIKELKAGNTYLTEGGHVLLIVQFNDQNWSALDIESGTPIIEYNPDIVNDSVNSNKAKLLKCLLKLNVIQIDLVCKIKYKR